ncbi:hypothetical protein GF391_01950 [Candidatus Uhrbacteria bacterium]|nr:hypothetical protein [Candidatus Uhrbacteria bacterium]
MGEENGLSMDFVKYVIVRLLKSFESYFWCLRYDFCNLFKIPHAGTGKECAKKRFLSMDAQMLVIVGSFAGMIFSAGGHSPFAIAVFAVVGFSSVLDFTFLRMRLERNEEADRCNDNNSSGGNGDDDSNGTGNDGDNNNGNQEWSCNGSQSDLEAGRLIIDRAGTGLITRMASDAREFVSELAGKANESADALSNALFGGCEKSHLEYAVALQMGGGFSKFRGGFSKGGGFS